MKRESHAMLAHQTKQVTFLLPKIGTQNETLDSNIEEGCGGDDYFFFIIFLCGNFANNIEMAIAMRLWSLDPNKDGQTYPGRPSPQIWQRIQGASSKNSQRKSKLSLEQCPCKMEYMEKASFNLVPRQWTFNEESFV